MKKLLSMKKYLKRYEPGCEKLIVDFKRKDSFNSSETQKSKLAKSLSLVAKNDDKLPQIRLVDNVLMNSAAKPQNPFKKFGKVDEETPVKSSSGTQFDMRKIQSQRESGSKLNSSSGNAAVNLNNNTNEKGSSFALNRDRKKISRKSLSDKQVPEVRIPNTQTESNKKSTEDTFRKGKSKGNSRGTSERNSNTNSQNNSQQNIQSAYQKLLKGPKSSSKYNNFFHPRLPFKPNPKIDIFFYANNSKRRLIQTPSLSRSTSSMNFKNN